MRAREVAKKVTCDVVFGLVKREHQGLTLKEGSREGHGIVKTAGIVKPAYQAIGATQTFCILPHGWQMLV